MARALGVRYDEIAIAPMFDAFQAALARRVRGPGRGHHRGEHPGAHPRHAADGAVEQDRRDRADHRQQERDGHRLLHAVRRHGGRLRGDQGHRSRRWSTGWRTGATPTTHGTGAGRSRSASSRAPPSRPSCGPTRPTRTACRPTRCSTRSCERYMENDRASDDIVAGRLRPRRRCERVARLIQINEYKRRQAPVGIRITPPRLRQGLALSHHRRVPCLNGIPESPEHAMKQIKRSSSRSSSTKCARRWPRSASPG